MKYRITALLLACGIVPCSSLHAVLEEELPRFAIPVSKEEIQKVALKDVVGIEKITREIKEVVSFLKNPAKFERLGARPPSGILLEGKPGVGKTMIAKAIANEAQASFFEVAAPEIESMWVGESAANVRRLFEQAREHAPSIIFIDEIDAIGRKREGQASYKAETVNQLLAELDGFKSSDGITVIAATNFAKSLDDALMRPGRFDRIITVPLPDKAGREKILNLYIKKLQKVARGITISKIVSKTKGFSGAELKNLVDTAALNAVRRDAKKVEQQDFDFALKQTLEEHAKRTGKTVRGRLERYARYALKGSKWALAAAVALYELKQIAEMYGFHPSFDLRSGLLKGWKNIMGQGKRREITGPTLDELVGMESAKTAIRELTSYITNPASFTRLDPEAKPPKGILLAGPPGVGKTAFAAAVAQEIDAHFIPVSGSEFVRIYVGTGAAKVENLFQEARANAPTVIFIDEFDALARKRTAGIGGSGEYAKAVNQLLKEMDGVSPLENVIVLAATNFRESLDPAVLRPGRFDEIVSIELPNDAERRGILELYIRKLKNVGTLSDENWSELVDDTEEFSGAELKHLVKKAARYATRRGADAVEWQDFERALRETIDQHEQRGSYDEEERPWERQYQLYGQHFPHVMPRQQAPEPPPAYPGPPAVPQEQAQQDV